MAMTSDKKLYVAAGLLVVLGAGYYLQRRQQKQEEATYSYAAINASLPKIEISDDQKKAIDSITIEQPAGDAGKPTKVVLTKKSEDEWDLTEPLKAKANKGSVDSLLDNIKDIKVNESISSGKDSYAQYDVSDEKAVHVVVKQGDKTLADLYFGQGGSRGQMMRVAGKDGVFSAKGYSSYLYSKDLKGWRDLTITKFEDDKVKSVSIENENGDFEFVKVAKSDDKKDGAAKGEWAGRFKKAKGGALAAIERFDPSKVGDLLRTWKSLTALDFAQGKTAADVGLDKPSAKVTFVLDDGAHKVIQLGKTGSSSDRWIQAEGNPELFTIAQYSADWVTSNVDKYQKPEEKKDKKDKKPGDSVPPSMPGMPGMPGMPPH